MRKKSEASETKPDIPAPDDAPAVEADVAHEPAKSGKSPKERLRHLLDLYLSKKKLTIPLTVLLVIGVVLAVPFTRYTVLGLAIKKDYKIIVVDGTFSRPVSKAKVSIGGKTVETDAKGMATINLSVGSKELKVTKKYYTGYSEKVLVPFSQKLPHEVSLEATGHEVSLSVVNRITGKPVQGALVAAKAEGAEVKTDKDGKAIMVLPIGKKSPGAGSRSYNISITGQGFNELKHFISVKLGAEAPVEHKYEIVPSGKIYFLSKKSGKIDVVKTDLDGENRQTVLAGTGKEEERNTILLASRDWKYLALLSRRDSEKPKLYLIETNNDKLTVMDEGNAEFRLVGWSDTTFAYYVYRTAIKDWEPNKYAVKSYNAASHKLSTLDQSAAEGGQYDYRAQFFNNFYLVGDKVVYATNWNYAYYIGVGDKQIAIRSVSVNGQNKKDVKTFPANQRQFYNAKPYSPDEIYFVAWGINGAKDEVYEYDNGTVKLADIDTNRFNDLEYPTYLESPDKQRVFWSEQRDGKDTFFLGDAKAESPKEIAVLPEHQVYGWYGNDYLLVSKKGSELYIMPVDGSKLVKVADYHKPTTSFRGYGGGYGGL